MNAADGARPGRPWLMLVSDRRRLCAAAGRPAADGADLLVEQAHAAARAGVTAFQVREPDLDARTLLVLVERVAEAAGRAMRVLVNERADVAAAAGVGVHLRASSMPAVRVRPALASGAWITRAVHTVDDLQAVGPVAAVVAGTVLASASKPAGHRLLGLTGLAEIAAESPVPVIALGGLSGADWPGLRDAGAAGVAAIGAFLPRAGESPAGAVQRAVADLRRVLGEGRGGDERSVRR